MNEGSSEKSKRGPDDQNLREIWIDLIHADSQEGRKKLTPDQLRTLEIRKTAISVTNAINELIEYSNDPIEERSLVAEYYEGMLKLSELGIKENMHVGDKPDSFDNPKKMAEWIAGQLIEKEGKNLPNIPQALNSKASASLMSNKELPIFLTNAMDLGDIVKVTHRALYSDQYLNHSSGDPVWIIARREKPQKPGEW